MLTVVPPSTGKKKKARRVFGDVVVEDLNSSLSYSPSPLKRDTINEDSKSLETLVEEDSCTTADAVSLSETNGSTVSGKENEQIYSNGFPTLGKRVPTSSKHRPITFPEKRSTLRLDRVKNTQDAINRASESVHRTLQQSFLRENNATSAKSVNQGLIASKRAKEELNRQKEREASKIRQEWQDNVQDAKQLQQETQNYRQETLNIYRKLSQQISMQKANQHQEKKSSSLQKIEEDVSFKSLVYREHQEKLREEKERLRRLSCKKKAKQRENYQVGIETMKMMQSKEDSAIHDERYAFSVATRTFAQDIAARRRKSFAFRNGDAKRIREVFAAMEAKRQDDEHRSLELKRASHKDAEAYKRSLELQRRQSLAGRNEYASNQRKLVLAELRKQKEVEHQSFELKWNAERDANLYRKQENDRRRLSLAMRNEIAKSARMKQQERESKEREREYSSYELKRAADKDVDNFRQVQELLRRKSFEKRGEDSRRQQAISKQRELEFMITEHENYELRRNAAKDAAAYEQQLARERRESLANRNKVRSQHANLMAELHTLALEKDSESYMLKWAGEADAKAYLDRLNEERRKSLQLRASLALQARAVEESKRQQELEQQHNDELLRSNDHKDVESYKKACADRDRRSLEYRRKESRLQRIHAKELEVQKHHDHVDSFLLESKAWFDVQEYVEECKVRRRLSLAYRAKEKRQHVQWERRRTERERDERSKLVRGRLLDQHHVELARQKELAKNAFEALQRLGRSSSKLSTSNPFETILR